MRKRCAHCNGRFGLIRHRYRGRQFCSNTQGKKCKERFVAEQVFHVRQQSYVTWLLQPQK